MHDCKPLLPRARLAAIRPRAILLMAVALWLAATPGTAQVLRHRYSFTGNATDSIGGANGTVVGAVTFQFDGLSHGTAAFAGGTSASAPGYIRLPVGVVSDLQNATIEIFTTNFDMPKDQYGVAGGQFQALFSVGGSYGNQATYAILAPNRAGAGLGVGLRRNGAAEQVITGRDPLPVWRLNHVVHLVYAGYSGLGSTGMLTILLDGVVVAQSQTALSFAYLASAPGGITTVGIGGGSPFNDPTFRGGMSEVRIYDGPLTTAQIQANLNAGPDRLGFTLPYTFTEAARALQIAGGLSGSAGAAEVARLNLEPGGASPDAVDVLDALRIARKAAGIEPNP